MAETKDLAKLVTEMCEANCDFKRAEADEQAARSKTCYARNEVNRLQGEIDKVLEAMKKDAPRDTRWRETRGVAVP